MGCDHSINETELSSDHNVFTPEERHRKIVLACSKNNLTKIWWKITDLFECPKGHQLHFRTSTVKSFKTFLISRQMYRNCHPNLAADFSLKGTYWKYWNSLKISDNQYSTLNQQMNSSQSAKAVADNFSTLSTIDLWKMQAVQIFNPFSCDRKRERERAGWGVGGCR